LIQPSPASWRLSLDRLQRTGQSPFSMRKGLTASTAYSLLSKSHPVNT